MNGASLSEVLTWDVILYDQHQAWSPSLNASARGGAGVGGWEVYQVQIATWLAASGLRVLAMNAGGGTTVRREAGVVYLDAARHPGDKWLTRALITGRHSPIPADIEVTGRTVTSAVDDPRFTSRDYEHLKGRSTIVCLSAWQADLYSQLGHATELIPSMIDDAIYDDTPCDPSEKYGLVCVSAWNKGTDATLAKFADLRRRHPSLPGLRVGSPYGAPPDAAQRCHAAGAQWLGALTPAQVVRELALSEAVFRVCERPETFGVTDAIAEVVGTRVHCLCTNGYGAAREVLSSPYVTDQADRFEVGVVRALGCRAPKADYRVSTVMPRWLKMLGLN